MLCLPGFTPVAKLDQATGDSDGCVVSSLAKVPRLGEPLQVRQLALVHELAGERRVHAVEAHHEDALLGAPQRLAALGTAAAGGGREALSPGAGLARPRGRGIADAHTSFEHRRERRTRVQTAEQSTRRLAPAGTRVAFSSGRSTRSSAAVPRTAVLAHRRPASGASSAATAKREARRVNDARACVGARASRGAGQAPLSPL